MFQAEARLYYRVQPRLKVVADLLCPEISHLARKLIPKELDVRPQRYAPHISIVRHEVPAADLWNAQVEALHGKVFTFNYDTHVYNDETYYWLRVFSDDFEWVRVQLGLPRYSPWARPPDGTDCFHITVGNCKHHRRS